MKECIQNVDNLFTMYMKLQIIRIYNNLDLGEYFIIIHVENKYFITFIKYR